MGITHETDEVVPLELHVRVRDLKWYTPIGWLRHAAEDMIAQPFASLFYGLAFVMMGVGLVQLTLNAPQHIISLITGFLIAGPFVSIGVYEISRRRETVTNVRFLPTLTAWRANISGISMFSMLLTLLVAGWMRASVVMFALFFSDQLPSLSMMLSKEFMVAENLTFMAIYSGTALAFLYFVFAVSVISVPIMLDKDIDALGAIFASVKVVRENPFCMLTWAMLIVVMIGAGFAIGGYGLILTAPLIGHGTWHAYRALIE
ncbi:DUF2189 domain-containing protein [Burkholderiaceae bacterium DAT-1]|nr:DUF2189 domain-containing protein [Burkholderiaceae bacterium DAT-1]